MMMTTGRQRALTGIGLGTVAGALALVLACSPVADKSAEQPVTGAAATTTAAATTPAAATSPVAATGMVTPTAEEQAAAASSVVFGQLPDVTTAATATCIDPAQEGEAYVAGEVLVTLFKGTTVEQLNGLVQGAASLEKRELEPSDLLSCKEENGVLVDSAGMDPVVLLHVAQGSNVAQAAAEVSSSPVVESASSNSILRLQTQKDGEALRDRLGTTELVTASTSVNDPFAGSQWHLAATRLPQAWDLSRCDGSVEVGDDDVAVAIIDTGILTSHEDLAGNIIATYDATTDSEEIHDRHGHGTHVAGISNAKTNNGTGVAGASYNAKTVAIRIFSDYGKTEEGDPKEPETYVSYVVRAMDYLLTNQEAMNIRVANFSVGGGLDENPTDTEWSSDEICSRVTELRNRENGLLFVAAAGNHLSAQYEDGELISPEYTPPYNEYPGDYDDCLSVMNLQQGEQGVGYVRSQGSNYNAEGVTAESKNQTKDIAAPGTSIISSYPLSDSSYVYQGGTSMASPLVAGISALCFAEDPTLTPDDVQNLIQNTANTEAVGQTGWSSEYGYGMIDAYAAVSHIMSNVSIADVPDQDFTGTPVQPTLTLTRHDGTPLVEGTDYTVSFENNDALGTATATITGMGDYVGTTSKQFQLTHEAIADTTATYDGKHHTIQVVNEADTLLYSSDGGKTFTLTDPPAITNSGSLEVVCQASRDDAIIGTFRATATVTPVPLTVTSVTASDKTYDGTTSAAVTGVALAGAVGSERPTATAAVANFDTAAAGTNKTVTATGFALDAGNPVNANYELAATNATTKASVLPRHVTLTSASASKAYDGKPLTARRVDVGGDGWADGEGATYSYTVSQTAVGSSANAFTYELAANTLAANYDITTATGTLTVTPAPQAVMYRLYNPNSGEHFYTASRGERDALVAVGWTYEGRGWNAPTTGSPVYRLYNANAGDHHYTVSRGERDALVAVGWAYEGVGWNSGGARPLWRQYNPNAVAGSHNYTQSTSERDALVALGWRDEGIAWYGL